MLQTPSGIVQTVPEPLKIVEEEKACKPKIIRKKPKKYNKFSSENLRNLKEIYAENKYPSRELMHRLAIEMTEKMEKIQNWFKHQRKKEVLKGSMKYEKKNTFNKEQHHFLQRQYSATKNPSGEQYQLMADKIQCKVKHVKNWFSYKRKKELRIKRVPSFVSTQEDSILSPSIQPEEHLLKPIPVKHCTIPSPNSVFAQHHQPSKPQAVPQNILFKAQAIPMIAIPLNSSMGINLLLKSNVNANMEANHQMLQNLNVLYGQILKNQQYLSLVNLTLGNKLTPNSQ